MTTFEAPLQKAIYTALNGNVNVGGVVPVYDHVGPADVDTFPRVQFGTVEVDPRTDKDDDDQDIFVTLAVWSRQRGKKQTQDVMSAIHTLLHRQTLSLDSGTLIQLTADQPTRILLDPDGLTYHGVQTWRGQVQG